VSPPIEEIIESNDRLALRGSSLRLEGFTRLLTRLYTYWALSSCAFREGLSRSFETATPGEVAPSSFLSTAR